MDTVAIAVVGLLVVTVLAAIAGAPIALTVFATVLVRRRFGVVAATLVTALLVTAYAVSPLPRIVLGVLMLTVPQTRVPIAHVDLLLSRGAREEVVRLAAAQQLIPGEYIGQYAMPQSAAGLSVWGDVHVIDDGCGQLVFFMTLTGFSPDPYAGLEYVPTGCDPEPDPEGSGAGIAMPLGGPWYWIEAR
ncbi:MAG TPA: hypothetical protein VGQ02_02415 [Candidatus Limnocylindrales bacterium]|nr:hypothetical protein [Candidatus Limnocylindrales bacterium]